MADLEISQLPALAGVDLAATDPLPLADLSASETKRITAKDLVQYGIALIDDGSIPGAKVSSTLPAGSIDTAEIADNAVTSIKLADDSSCFVGAALPASGDFEGQLALTTGDNKLYAWNGSSWVSAKAAGSINTVAGTTSTHATVSVSTVSGTATLTVTLVNSSGANQFYAGPSNAAGAITLRQIVASDLPEATVSAKGAVSVPSGEGIRIAAGGNGALEIDNDLTASSNYHLVTYTDKGLINAGRAITSADLPISTSGTIGAIKPSAEFTVDGSGVLNHANQLGVASTTAAKVTFDAQGHITASSSLLAADIPDLDASKITTGTFAAGLYATNSITGNKLANESIVKFGGAGSTEGIVTFPTAEFKGQYFYDEINQDLYIWSGSAWLPVTIISGELVYAGTYDASVNQVASVTSAGAAVGLTVGAALPAASSTNNRYYLIISDSGTGTGNAPAEALAPPDMVLSNGTSWDLIDVSSAIGSQLASNVTFTPYGNITANNVQAALEDLDDDKLETSGGTISGQLLIGTAGSIAFEGSVADEYETILTATNPTADRSIVFPNQSGNVLVSGNASIVNADISASAAIAVSKLAAGTARQLLQTNAGGTAAEFTSNVDIPGTLDVTGTATFDGTVNISDGTY